MNKKVLIVDDEPSIREFFQILFNRMSEEGALSSPRSGLEPRSAEQGVGQPYPPQLGVFEVVLAEDGEKALKLLQKKSFDIVISDLKMPGLSGLELLQKAKKLHPDMVFILITAFDTTQTAVRAMKMGAYDYISKPFNVKEIRRVVFSAFNMKKQEGGEPEDTGLSGFLLGESVAMQKVFKEIQQVAPSSSNILITGDSGTGKEMVARLVHSQSTVKNRPFVAVNCGAIPDTLIESEMFGHKKGSFTGAVVDKKGFFEIAEGGILFLDEIGELPLTVQPKLLRALQEKTIRPVGGIADKKVEVRLITATNRDLEHMVSERNFREDLFYRLNVIRIRVPPLRERKEDIPFFVQYFLKKQSQKLNRPVKQVSQEALVILKEYAWPGNVRQLENLMERVMILSEGEEIRGKDILSILGQNRLSPTKIDLNLFKISLPAGGLDMIALMDRLEKSLLEQALQKTEGAKKPAADLLKLSLRTFRYRLQKYNLDHWS